MRAEHERESTDALPAILEVQVEPELCARFLNCVRTAKGAFRVDRATGKSMATPSAAETPAEQLWKAGKSCPSGAIRFVTAAGYVMPRWYEAAGWDMTKHPAAGLSRRKPPAG